MIQSSDIVKEEYEHVLPGKCPSNLSIIENELAPSGFLNTHPRAQLFGINTPPNIEHELNVAKSLMQQGSSITGDSLFDHLADLIKLVVKERPKNIADYFEEFSYNVREQKFRIPEQFPWQHYDPPNVEAAKKYFSARKMPSNPPIEYDVCKETYGDQYSKTKASKTRSAGRLSLVEDHRKLLLNENVLRLHLHWSLCGFQISTSEVQHLACALQKIQFHPTVEHARFWGKLFGLGNSYYIVEAMLTRSEINKRLEIMQEEIKERMSSLRDSNAQHFLKNTESEFFPGSNWDEEPNWPAELDKAKYSVKDVPTPKPKEFQFDIPPEAVGTGLNRRAYFVVNSLDEDWIELPIATPKQIQVSRQIKKFFTGDLEAEIVSYPSFPGTEKHYLRAMIARITSGAYIAPLDYYRRLTKREQMLKERGLDTDMDEIEFEVELEEDDELNNDAMIIENDKYIPNPEYIINPNQWVHVRPNVLDQGRVMYFDEAKARKAQRDSLFGVGSEMLSEENSSEKDEIIEEDDRPGPESGPVLFTQCDEDVNEEVKQVWSQRYSSTHNQINQLTIMRSNVWPGAYSFTFDKYSDSIYLGWGVKSVDRNMTVPHIPPIEEDYCELTENKETTDPTVAMEEDWYLYQKKKQMELEALGEEEEDADDDVIC